MRFLTEPSVVVASSGVEDVGSSARDDPAIAANSEASVFRPTARSAAASMLGRVDKVSFGRPEFLDVRIHMVFGGLESAAV